MTKASAGSGGIAYLSLEVRASPQWEVFTLSRIQHCLALTPVPALDTLLYMCEVLCITLPAWLGEAFHSAQVQVSAPAGASMASDVTDNMGGNVREGSG